jgi:hypothetical protein
MPGCIRVTCGEARIGAVTVIDREQPMSANPWLAVDAGTSPQTRAREVREAWERFVADQRDAQVRFPIARSWRRSQNAGVDPSRGHAAPSWADAQQAAELWEAHPLAAAASLIQQTLAGIAAESGHIVVVSDTDGVALWIQGDARVRSRAADMINLAEGASWSEESSGTNAIGTALAADHAVQVFAAEHFIETVHAWTCSAAPVHDPDDGRLLGVIDISGPMETAHAHTLGLAVSAARAVESELRWALREREAMLRSRYEERVGVGAGPRALVSPTGRVLTQHPSGWLSGQRLDVPAGGGELVLPSGTRVFAEPLGREQAFVVRTLGEPRSRRHPGPVLHVNLLGRDRADLEIDGVPIRLSPRHSEILALLTAHPDGVTSEQLAADLYGDAGQPGSARVELFRMRKHIGGWVAADPYRLSIAVESDAGRVRGLLDRGAVREAAECYQGPLLPHSEAPGVVRDRDALDAWLRQAVMTSDDNDALWAWVQTPSGCDDLPAWKRLLGRLDFHDARRSLVASHIAALRNALQD